MKTLKRTGKLTLALMGVSILSACDSGPERSVTTFNSLEECKSSSEIPVEQCDAAYASAQKQAEEGVKYSTEKNCAADFADGCQRTSDGNFVPFMAGFMVSQVISNIGGNSGDLSDAEYRKRKRDSMTYTPAPVYRSKDNPTQLRTSGNTVVGKVGTVSSTKMSNYSYSQANSKPKAIVTSRGGFGKTASARGGWGG